MRIKKYSKFDSITIKSFFSIYKENYNMLLTTIERILLDAIRIGNYPEITLLGLALTNYGQKKFVKFLRVELKKAKCFFFPHSGMSLYTQDHFRYYFRCWEGERPLKTASFHPSLYILYTNSIIKMYLYEYIQYKVIQKIHMHMYDPWSHPH